MQKWMIVPGVLLLIACGSSTGSQGGDTSNIATDTALTTVAADSTALDIQPLTGYFLKNTIPVTDSLTYWIINDQRTFDSLFAPAKTMTNTIITPDFGTQLVIAATMPGTSYGTTIQLQSATGYGNNKAALHFIATGKEKQSYQINPVWLGTLPKTGLATIDFYTGNNLARTSNIPQ
jgi:hypothetical protein